MTRSQATELLPVLEAYAQGKEVQRWHVEHDPAAKRQGAWMTDPDPAFNLCARWRVKPEAREWLVIVEEGVIVEQLQRQGARYAGAGETVLVREVIQ